jgi:membrane-associated protein
MAQSARVVQPYGDEVHLALIAHTGLLDPEGLLRGFGPLALAMTLAILVIECGVIFGAVLPGDSLLFMTGVLLASGFITVPWWIAMPAMVCAAFTGNVIGYWTGQRVGPALLRRPDSRLFRHEYVERTHSFFAQYGPRAIVLARFVPIVRAVITSVAGIAGMDRAVFLRYSAIGAAAWVVSMTTAGMLLGQIAVIRDNIDFVTLAVIALSLVPVAIEVVRGRRSKG